MKPALSFIIPVYNGSDFIVRCLDSICNLDLSEQEYEVIVIDDCSTDNTRDIVRQYINSHPQVCLLCQPENHRQGAARNWGIREAKGEYITLVDGDDVVLEGVLNALHWTKQLHADMVYCSCIHENSHSESILKQIDMPEGKVLTGRDFCEQYQQEGVFWYPWGFLMRREWLISLHYPLVEDRQHEDRDWMAYVLSHATLVCNSPTPMYRYTCNPNSTCRAPRYSTIFDHVASGIRHIRLSEDLASTCPNLSKTLYAFGQDEIYKSLRFRNLTKYSWTDNKHLYDQQHLKPLLTDIKHLFPTLPKEIRLVVNMPVLTSVFLCIAHPLTKVIRQFKQTARKFKPSKS